MSVAIGAVGSLLPSLQSSCSLEAFGGRGEASAPVTINGPPRSTVQARAHNMSIVTIAPSRTVVASKKKRKRGRRPDAGDGGNDDGGPGDGGNWGGGWGDDESEERPRWANPSNVWMWQLLCVCSLIQAAHHMATKHQEQPQRRMAFFTFASTAATAHA